MSASQKEQFDVIVLGAGAAGLMCAITAANRGRRVLVLEKSNKPGKKILMSGGGRCNFTNLYVEPDNFISDNPHFCKSALNGYTQWDFIALIEGHQIAYDERKHGQLFCRDSAKDVLAMLLGLCEQAQVEIRCKTDVSQVTFKAQGEQTPYQYSIDANGTTMSCESLVVATGALSIPTLGGSGFGYDLAKQLSLDMKPLRAGLVPFTFTDAMKACCERLSGVSLDVEITAGDQIFREDILFTHRGMSGPVVLQISSYWQSGETIDINLLPDTDATSMLVSAKAEKGSSLLRTVLAQHLPRALVLELQSLWWQDGAERALAEFTDVALQEIGAKINRWQLKPSGTEGYRTAEVTLGGVNTDELNAKTMEVRRQPGLYFIGEVVDVSGHLGGFNFQWAWSSGFSAGSVA